MALLGGFATMAAVFLISGNDITKEAIEQRRQEDLRLSLNQVIPNPHYDGDLLGNTLTMLALDGSPLTI